VCVGYGGLLDFNFSLSVYIIYVTSQRLCWWPNDWRDLIARSRRHTQRTKASSLSLSRSFFFLFFPFGSVLFDDGGNVKEFRARQRWARCSTFGRLWNRKKRKKGNENKIKKTTTKRNGSSPFLHNATRNVRVCVYTLGYEWRGDLFDPFDWLEGGKGDPSYRDPTRSLSSFSRSKDINFPELKKEKKRKWLNKKKKFLSLLTEFIKMKKRRRNAIIIQSWKAAR
jgi:hypothetical protein